MHSAHSRNQAPSAKAARTAMAAAATSDQLAGVDGPQIPARLAAKVAEAIAAESARRQLIPAR